MFDLGPEFFENINAKEWIVRNWVLNGAQNVAIIFLLIQELRRYYKDRTLKRKQRKLTSHDFLEKRDKKK